MMGNAQRPAGPNGGLDQRLSLLATRSQAPPEDVAGDTTRSIAGEE